MFDAFTGTLSTPKQAMLASYLKYSKEHRCEKQLVFSTKETTRVSDRWFYSYQDVQPRYRFFSTVGVEDDQVVAREATVTEFIMGDTNLSLFGIYQLATLREEEQSIPLAQIGGKCVIVRNCICTLPKCTLVE